MTFRELCRKQVIQMESGVYLGHIDDLVLDTGSMTVESYVMLGRPRFFGLFGREECLMIPCAEVKRYGVDALLVTTPVPEAAAARQWHFPWEK